MKPRTKSVLTASLRELGRSTLQMLASEVGCVSYRAGHATNRVSGTDLGAFLFTRPLAARRAAALLRRASADPKYRPVVAAIEGVRGVGVTQVGDWTLTPVSDHALSLTHPARGALQAAYSTDVRVGLIVFTEADPDRATQAAHAGLPPAVLALAELMIEAAPAARSGDVRRKGR